MDSHLTRELDSDRFDFLKFVYKAKHGEDIEHLVRYDKETRRLSICNDGHQTSESLTDIQSQIDDILRDMEWTFYLNSDITITQEKETELNNFCNDLEVSQTDHVLVQKWYSADEDGTITVVLMGFNTESVMDHKHAIEVAVGLRRKPKTSRVTRVLERSVESLNLSETHFDEDTNPTDNKETFLTYEGMEISIRSGNIDEFEGENTCIVNPTNDKYKPTGGVSKALVVRGGDTYKNAIKALVSKHKSNIGDCLCSIAGDMNITKVIHLVCPGVKLSPKVLEDKKCGANIIRSIHNCLQVAEDECMKTIVFPFIYTGKLGRPVKVCCVLYAYAVLEYSRTRKHRENGTLKKIVFLSNIAKHVGEAVKIFEKIIPQRYEQWLKIHQDLPETDQDTERSSSDAVPGRRSEVADNSTVVNETDIDTGGAVAGRKSRDEDETSTVDDKHDSDLQTTDIVLRSRRNKADEHRLGARTTFRNPLTCGGVIVDFKLEDIRSYFVRALVCPVGQSPDEVSGNDLIGASIKAAYNAVFCDHTIEERVSKKLYRVKKCVTLTPCGDLAREDARRTRYIFHAVFPTYRREEKQKFEEDVTRSLDALFKRVQRENRKTNAVIEELAFPVFGIDSTSDTAVVREACASIARSLQESLLKMNDSKPFKMTIYFVNWCPKLHCILQEEFGKVWNQNAS